MSASAWGKRFGRLSGDKTGIRRYGHFTLPMEETLATVAADLWAAISRLQRPAFPALRLAILIAN